MTSAPGATTSGLISRSPWVGPQLLKPAIRLVSSGVVTYSPRAWIVAGSPSWSSMSGAVLEADHHAGDRRLRLEAVVGHDERRLAGHPVDHDHADRAGVLGVADLHREVAVATTEERDLAGQVGAGRQRLEGRVARQVDACG